MVTELVKRSNIENMRPEMSMAQLHDDGTTDTGHIIRPLARNLSDRNLLFLYLDCAVVQMGDRKTLHEVKVSNLFLLLHSSYGRKQALRYDFSVMPFQHDRNRQFPNLFDDSL